MSCRTQDHIALKCASSVFDSEDPRPPSLELRMEVPVQRDAVTRSEQKSPLLQDRPEPIESFIEHLILSHVAVCRPTRQLEQRCAGWPRYRSPCSAGSACQPVPKFDHLCQKQAAHEAPGGRHPEQRVVVVGYGHLLDAHRGKEPAGVGVRRGVEQEVDTALADEPAEQVKRVGAKIPVNDPGGAGCRSQLASFEEVPCSGTLPRNPTSVSSAVSITQAGGQSAS